MHADVHVGLVEEQHELLVIAADRLKIGAAGREVGAGHAVKQLVADLEIGGAAEVVGVAIAVDEHVFALKAVAGGVANEAADGDDGGVGVGREQIVEPIGFGDGVVVDEYDDVALGVRDAGVAGAGDVADRVDERTDEIGVAADDLLRVIDRGAVDDQHLEIRVAHLAQALQRAIERIGAVDRHDDDGGREGAHAVVTGWSGCRR